ncbi:uncharacterized protein LOC112985566 isoform X3 [Dromaius novaehollandiae]|uniref:uncharacterized protein LOC112985566 isoform X3 n=1 Tax=Dromaius novaehollandiae TaxID=8790 RepID=UPI00311E9E94
MKPREPHAGWEVLFWTSPSWRLITCFSSFNRNALPRLSARCQQNTSQDPRRRRRLWRSRELQKAAGTGPPGALRRLPDLHSGSPALASPGRAARGLLSVCRTSCQRSWETGTKRAIAGWDILRGGGHSKAIPASSGSWHWFSTAAFMFDVGIPSQPGSGT